MQDYDEGRDPARTRPWEFRPPLAILLMGVAGSGKTTVGRDLASALGWSFADADDFHPPANIAKMAAGIPLDDADRAPWLRVIGEYLRRCLAHQENTVVTCSALKESYRRAILADAPSAKLVYLKGSRELLRERISSRSGHFMKPEMLDSQLTALEEPADALVVDIAQTPDEIITKIRQSFGI